MINIVVKAPQAKETIQINEKAKIEEVGIVLSSVRFVNVLEVSFKSLMMIFIVFR